MLTSDTLNDAVRERTVDFTPIYAASLLYKCQIKLPFVYTEYKSAISCGVVKSISHLPIFL